MNAQVDIAIGTGTVGNTATSYPCPIQDRYEGSRSQFLYRASELTAAGMSAGTISAIRFNVVSMGTVGVVEQYTIKLTTTSTTSLSATGWEAGVTTVYGPVNYQPVVGVNSFTLAAPFAWNGIDNLVVEVCNGDPNSTAGTTWTNNPVISWTTGLSFNGSRTYRADNLDNLCGAVSTTENGTQTTRPNIIFAWTPAANCAGTPTGGTAVTSAPFVCSGDQFNLSVTGSTVAAGITYQWQSSPNNSTWTDIGGATSGSFSTTQTATTWYRVKVTCANGGAFDFSSSVQVTTPAAVAGTFTINSALPSGGTNFQSFNDAYNYIKCGIAGPVVFNVVSGSGPYNEQLIMSAVPGASATNTITFNGNGATLSFLSTNTNERGIIKLDGADHVIFDNLVITATGTSTSEYGFGVQLINDADSNTVRNCTININTATTSTNYAGIVISASATSATSTTGTSLCDGNTFANNTINGGYYGVTLVGSTTAANSIQNNKVTGNTIRDWYLYGIYVTGTISSVMEGNNIQRPTRTTGGATNYGIYLTALSTKALISKNIIHSIFDGDPTTTDDFYGIYLTGVDATSGNENVVSNNVIHDITSNGLIYGIYNAGSDNAHYFHNTISLDHAGSASTEATRGFYQTTAASGIQFRNNLISISRGGTGTKHAIYMGTATTTYTSNNNNFYIIPAATHYVGFSGSNQVTLANWQTATSQDANSVSIDPVYVDLAGGNLRPTASALDNLGAPVGITTDVLNAPRSATTPDIGAYEFSVGTCVTPPTPGTATSSAAAPICPNTLVNLNLTGNSIGIGQTYQWESAAAPGGPWTAVSGVLSAPAFDVNPTVTTYYRAAVTCSGNTTYSVPVQVVVNVLFPGGTYTINKAVATGGTNFQSFNDAYDAMKCGIAGPVIFNVVAGSGPYNEQLLMQEIQGASAINTITFNGNGNTITFVSTNTNERAVIKLNGTDHVTFNNLVINPAGTTTSEYGFGIQLMNDADSNTVNNCTININTSSTSTNYAGIVVSISNTSAVGTGDNKCDYNTFSNNTINGGYYGLTLIGSTGTANGNNKIIKNRVSEFYQYGIYLNGSFTTLVDSNVISRPTRSTVTTFYGVYVTSLNVRANVTRNTITNPFGGAAASTSTFYGIYHNASDPLPTFENLVTNNLIFNITGNGDAYGLYNSSSNNTWYYHNTISLDGGSTGAAAITRGFYQTTQADGLELKNNIFTVTRTGPGPKHILYFNTITSTIVSDRNNLYRLPTVDNAFVGFFGANQASLTDWQTASTQDANSVASDPIFTNAAAGNFMPTNASIDNIGTPVGVAIDITGAPRSATTPDVGAWEFFPGGCVAPPTPGIASATPDTVCENTNVALKLTGNTTGTGQTYQWETSTSAAGTYTPLGNVLTNPDSVIVATTTLWYRVAVTCSGNTTYSTPVQLVVYPALPAGTYTINSAAPASATNFISFNAAKAAMSCGIAGPVVFNVAPGGSIYNEQLILDSIAGTSSVNTITFNGNGNTIKFSPTVTGERAVIKLRKTDHVIFDSLNIDATGGTYGYGVQLINNADSNTFRKCIIIAATNSTSTDFAGFVVNASETDETATGNTLCDANTFDRNTITGGYYGFTLIGSATAGLEIVNNKIINNNIIDYYSYGVYVSRTTNTVISGNNMSRPTRTGSVSAYGVYLTALSSNTLINANRIHNLYGGV
ncbi:MAG TPA: right-handed parallel beta-helix repeat-containing protein, partial [Chitinophagaceae bacterium]